MNPNEATREVLWNIRHGWIMYALFVPTLAVASFGVYRSIRNWRCGQPAQRFDRPWLRFKRLMVHAVLQLNTWRDPLAGVFHAMLFWGIVTLTIATTVVLIHHDFHLRIMQGRFYLYFQSLFVDVLGALALVGALMAAGRRWITRPSQLVYTDQANWILVLLIAILATGFLVEGWRMAVTKDPWAAWSPCGLLVARASSMLAKADTLRFGHAVMWWLHLVLVFGLIAWAPYTKLMHVLTAPLNIYTSNLDSPTGRLRAIDFESATSLGVNSLEQFTWKDLLDLDSCTECGRCTAACPAHRVGKQLSPRDLILDLGRLQRASDLTSLVKVSTGGDDQYKPALPLIDTSPALSQEALWQCTTCAACVDACPVGIEQLTKIVEMRRYQVMEEAEFPALLQDALASLEERGHPFRGAAFSRLNWADGLNVPVAADGAPFDVLLWVGCAGALVERSQRTTRALAQLLTRAGTKFAMLGREEKCTGDLARRVGNEFLFESLVQDNIATFEKYDVRTLVTPCPHCFHSLKNEYPRWGSKVEVFHHTTFLAKLIGEGRLAVDNPQARSITLHDACYLARHNQIIDTPRALLTRATTQPLREMAAHGKQGFCCGGGGGMSFLDEPSGQRVNQERARQALSCGADTVAVACPFCTTMLEDGLRAVQDEPTMTVRDVAEVLWEAVSDNDADP
jgi:Fe-S oxidoreductase/nitrate reductase gamma subunit